MLCGCSKYSWHLTSSRRRLRTYAGRGRRRKRRINLSQDVCLIEQFIKPPRSERTRSWIHYHDGPVCRNSFSLHKRASEQTPEEEPHVLLSVLALSLNYSAWSANVNWIHELVARQVEKALLLSLLLSFRRDRWPIDSVRKRDERHRATRSHAGNSARAKPQPAVTHPDLHLGLVIRFVSFAARDRDVHLASVSRRGFTVSSRRSSRNAFALICELFTRQRSSRMLWRDRRCRLQGTIVCYFPRVGRRCSVPIACRERVSKLVDVTSSGSTIRRSCGNSINQKRILHITTYFAHSKWPYFLCISPVIHCRVLMRLILTLCLLLNHTLFVDSIYDDVKQPERSDRSMTSLTDSTAYLIRAVVLLALFPTWEVAYCCGNQVVGYNLRGLRVKLSINPLSRRKFQAYSWKMRLHFALDSRATVMSFNNW